LEKFSEIYFWEKISKKNFLKKIFKKKDFGKKILENKIRKKFWKKSFWKNNSGKKANITNFFLSYKCRILGIKFDPPQN